MPSLGEVDLGRTEHREWDALTSGPAATVMVPRRTGRGPGPSWPHTTGWRAYVYHLAVAPQFRRGGIGSDLFAAALRYLSDHQARRAYAMVGDQKTPGLALTAKAGFEPDGDIVFARVPQPRRSHALCRG